MKRTTHATVVMIVALLCACFMASCAKASAEQPQASSTSEPLEVSDVAVDATTTAAVDNSAQDVDETDEATSEPDEQAEISQYSDSEPVWDVVCYEEQYEPVYYEYSGYSGSDATTLDDLLNGQGRAYDENGTSYTWYYHDLGYGALDIPGETFDADGVSHDEDGYIVVATDAYAKGEIIDTPYGEARVYDSGCGSTIDIYTNR
ncbi:MAG: hypothetical protein IIZ12_04210 [Eggerthellaceae bacterium]|nr:hypothetical protein [Eggerthellaceae bacterium]